MYGLDLFQRIVKVFYSVCLNQGQHDHCSASLSCVTQRHSDTGATYLGGNKLSLLSQPFVTSSVNVKAKVVGNANTFEVNCCCLAAG